MTIKRYALFEFENYYPSGGFNDFRESFDSVDEAVAYYHLPRPRPTLLYDSIYAADCFQVVDMQTGVVIAEN